jgi:phospholipase C
MRLRILPAVGASAAVATPAALSIHHGALHPGPVRSPIVAVADHDPLHSGGAAGHGDHRAAHANPGGTASGAASAAPTAPPGQPAPPRGPSGIHKIRHIIVIMQENRSFDSYFGTYPGADGIPAGVCVPDPLHGGCVRPYPDHQNSNLGGPHRDANFTADVAGGRMDGFVAQAETRGRCRGHHRCRAAEVMGYHTGSDIPNYWAYAKNFVLNDHMFESAHSWSLPSHMYMVSAWAANCRSSNPMSCVSNDMPRNRTAANPTPFAWTDLTWLLHRYHVSWGYYLDHGAQSPGNAVGVPAIWNVLPGFTDVTQDGQLNNVQPLTNFMAQAKAGTLPKVSWIVPNPKDSEHPPALVSTGQAYVTKIINAVMRSRDWNTSAIFVSWDDWGGFYDHVNPQSRQLDAGGYGIRVPALVISPYARQGFIDHQALSFDAYLRFIEDAFMGDARLDPATDGRPDSRPGVRENAPILGNLASDFNFRQAPRPPLILNPCPPTTLVPTSSPGCTNSVPLHFSS